MFTTEELDARMVESWCDQAMSRAGRAALDKIRAVAPAALLEAEEVLLSFASRDKPKVDVALSPLRAAIRAKRLVTFAYADARGRARSGVCAPCRSSSSRRSGSCSPGAKGATIFAISVSTG